MKVGLVGNCLLVWGLKFRWCIAGLVCCVTDVKPAGISFVL